MTRLSHIGHGIVLITKTKIQNAPMKTFEQLGVAEPLRRAIEELGFEAPMPVQE